MATEQEKDAIAGLYAAYFDRAPDPEGLDFWIRQLDGGRDFATISQDFAQSREAKEIYPYLTAPAAGDPEAFIVSIYNNLFNRDPDELGLTFWLDQLTTGKVLPGDMVEAVMMGAQNTIVDGVLIEDRTTIENKVDIGREFAERATQTEGFTFDFEAYQAARGAMTSVTADPTSVNDSQAFLDDYFADFQPSQIHTLHQQKILVEEGVDQFPTKTVIYWGYNPHPHDETEGVDNTAEPNTNNLTNEGPEDGGIPAAEFFGTFENDYQDGYLYAALGIDITEVLGIDTDADAQLYDFSALEEIEFTVGENDDGTGNIHMVFANGVEDDIVLTEEYFGLMRDLFFDEEGNSRFFEKEVPAQVPVYLDENGVPTTDPTEAAAGSGTGSGDDDPMPIGFIDAVIEGQDVFADVPIVLTPAQNNGSTVEGAKTSQLDDTIVAPYLDLLHQAYIDAGQGYNTLEIDAKGHFAQPKALLNIQHINIENLPNVYTGDPYSELTQAGSGDWDGGDNATQYPDVIEPDDPDYFPGDNDSIIDVTRATSLETMVVTQGDYEDLDAEHPLPGDLTVTGIRNAALVTVDGFWDDTESGGDLRLNYSGDSPDEDGITVQLRNVNIESDLEVAHNSPKLTLDSIGGANYIADGDLAGGEGNLRELVITGSAFLEIDNDLADSFSLSTPVTIDASANTGGVDLTLGALEFIDLTLDSRVASENSTGGSGGTDWMGDIGATLDIALLTDLPEEVTVFGSQADDEFTISTIPTLQYAARLLFDAIDIDGLIGDLGLNVNLDDIDVGDLLNLLGGLDLSNIGAGEISLGGLTIDVGDLDINSLYGDGFENDTRVTLTDIAGDNEMRIVTYDANITVGDGDNDIELITTKGEVTAGNGNNVLEAIGANVNGTFGDGDNRIELFLDESPNTSALGGQPIGGQLGALLPIIGAPFSGKDDVEVATNLNLGDGANEITVFAGGDEVREGELDVASINITAGDGGNKITIPALPFSFDGREQTDAFGRTLSEVSIETGSGDDEILVGGAEITIRSGGGTDDITLLGIDPDYVTEVASLSEVTTVGQQTTVISITGDVEQMATNPPEDAFITVNVDGQRVLTDAEITLGSVDVTSPSQVADRIAEFLDGRNGISAEVINDVQIKVTGFQGQTVDVSSLTFEDSVETLSAEVETFEAPTATDYNYKGFIPSVYGAVIDVDTGPGSATINLGAFADPEMGTTGRVVAMEGSVITGSDITLFVNTDADLRAADLSGITRVIMDDDDRIYDQQGYTSGVTTDPSGDRGGPASLTLLDTQVAQLQADGVDFSTQGETFGALSLLTVVITDDTVLSDLIDFDTWNESIKLAFVVEDGASLELTAEELHTYVAPEGIAVDDQNGYVDNQVTVTDAGPNFNAYGDQNGGIGGGTIAGGTPMRDVTVLFDPDGYERPEQDDPVNLIQWDSDTNPVIDVTVYPFASDLEITGAADLTVNGPIILGDAFTIDFSEFGGSFTDTTNGVSTLTVANFQAMTPDVNDNDDAASAPDFRNIPNNGSASDIFNGVPNPDTWGRIDGNGTSDDPVRVDMLVVDDTSTGDSDLGPLYGGFFSSGVQQFVLVDFHTPVPGPTILPQSIGGEAHIVVCDQTEDLQVLGLQNNRNAEVTFEQVAWGTDILLEGDGYANASDPEKNLGDPDLSQVGHVKVNFFEPGANAKVMLNNQGVRLGQNEDAEDGFDPTGERKLVSAGIILNNADRLLIEVEDGDALVEDVTGVDVERVLVTSQEPGDDVEIVIAQVVDLAEIDGNDDVRNNGSNEVEKGTGLDTNDLKSIDGTGVQGTFTLTFTGDTDLSGVDLSGVDAICFAPEDDPDTDNVDESVINVTMTADQLVEYGAVIETKSGEVSLDVVDMADQPLDLSAIDVENIGTVTFIEGEATLDATTNLGEADELVIPPESVITMTNAQFETALIRDGGNADPDDDGVRVRDGESGAEPAPTQGKLVLTITDAGLAGEIDVKLANVAPDLKVDLSLTDVTLNDQWDVTPTGAAETAGTTMVLNGTTDISEVPAGSLGTVDKLMLGDGATVTVSALQIQKALLDRDNNNIQDQNLPIEDVIGLAQGASATLNIVGVSDQFVDDGGQEISLVDLPLDLDRLVDEYPGLNIGTLALADTNDTIQLDGWTLGGADVLETPTADGTPPEFDEEGTAINLTQDQFFQLADGTITGEGTVNLIDVYNNQTGGPNGQFNPNSWLIDTSNVSANKGTITFQELDGDGNANPDRPGAIGEQVILNEAAVVEGFTYVLSDGQLIGFSTAEQASGAAIEEDVFADVNPTGIGWFFDEVTEPVDTSNYDGAIETLFISTALANGANEEDLWTTLPSSITVEKYTDGVPFFQLIMRTNTWQPFSQAPDGITFDAEENQTVQTLTLNLEGGVQLGDVTVNESEADEAEFTTLNINSYFDIESVSSEFGVDNDDDGLVDELLPPYDTADRTNNVGDINLTIGKADEPVVINLSTAEFNEEATVRDGLNRGGTGPDTDEGAPLEVGTIFLGMPGSDVNSAVINATGDHDIEIGGIDFSEPTLELVSVFTDLGSGNTLADGVNLTIGGVNYSEVAEMMGIIAVGDQSDLNGLYLFDNYTAAATDDFGPGGQPEVFYVFNGGTNDLTAMSTLASDNGVSENSGMYFSGPSTVVVTAAQLETIEIEDANGDGVADNFMIGDTLVPGDANIDITEIDGTENLDLDLIEEAGINIGTLTLAEGVDADFSGWTLGGADELVIPEDSSATLTQDQFNNELATGTVSGDGTLNLTDLYNDQADDTSLIDTSNVTAMMGTATLREEDGDDPDDVAQLLDVGEFVKLNAATDLSGFTIQLSDGQLIGFSTEEQASGAVVEELPQGARDNPTGIVWLFDTVTGPVDASGYDTDIDTLFIPELLADGANEEDLWDELAGAIVVNKYGGDAPQGLLNFFRTNTWEPFTAAPTGISFDDADPLGAIQELTLNLEGGVILGPVTVSDADEAEFTSLTINSYLDIESLPADAGIDDDGDGLIDEFRPGYGPRENVMGDITLNIEKGGPLAIDINTGEHTDDPTAEEGGTGAGSNAASAGNTDTNPGLAGDQDAGEDLEIGTIFLGTPGDADVPVTFTLTGDNDLTIAGIDLSDPALTRVDVLTEILLDGGELEIGGIDIGELAVDMGIVPGGTDELDLISYLDGFTADTDTDFNLSTGGGAGYDSILAISGDNDVTEAGDADADWAVDGILGVAPGTLTITAQQLEDIGIQGAGDGVADNFVLGPGVNPGDITINIEDLENGQDFDLDAIAAAGFNIGTITMSEDVILGANATLGGADEIIITLGDDNDPTVTLEMTAAQFKGFSGVISEQLVADPVNTTPDFYEGQVIVDELEGIEEGTATPSADIDLSQVTTTGENLLMLSRANAAQTGALPAAVDDASGNPGDGDVILTDTTNLGTFAVVLNDVNDTNPGTDVPNELAGHTIRFATVEQADGRTVIVSGPEPNNAEQDTNVVWLFETVPGPLGLDVSGYDENLGRIWVSDNLVDSVGGDIDSLFTIDDPDNPGTDEFTLAEGIIKRIESGDLTDALSIAQPFDQTIEVVSGATLNGILAEITDPVIFLENLTIDLGGLTNNGNLEVDNLIGVQVLGDDDFDVLTLNSFIADFYVDDSTKHYLLPDSFDADTQVLPTAAIQFQNAPNTFGDILAGGDRGVLSDIVVNTGEGDAQLAVAAGGAGAVTVNIRFQIFDLDGDQVGADISVNGIALTDGSDAIGSAGQIAAAINAAGTNVTAEALGSNVVLNHALETDLNGDSGNRVSIANQAVVAGPGSVGLTPSTGGERGTDFVAGTVFFSEDSDPETNTGTFDLNGVNDVTIKGMDITDPEIIISTVDTTGHLGTFNPTGGSAAWTGGDSTERLIFTNGSGDTGLIGFGGTFGDDPATQFTTETDFFSFTEVGGNVQAGVDGEALSLIDTSAHGGTINLGVVARLDGTGLNTDNTAGFDPADGFDDGFQLVNSGVGTVILCLGTAETTADGLQTPTLEVGGEWSFTGPGVELEMKEVVLEGTLNLTDVDLTITGDIDFTTLEDLTVSGGTIEVAEGGILRLTVEQVDYLEDTAGLDVFGAGKVVVTGESDSTPGDADTDFGNLRTAEVDLAAVTLAGTDDGVLQIEANGAIDENGDPLLDENGDRVAQRITGSANDDEVTVTADAEDGDNDTIDVITRLGADGGDIGEPNETPTDNTPTDATPEVVGDVIIRDGLDASVQIEVDAGFDTFEGDDDFATVTGAKTSAARTGDVFQVESGGELYVNGLDEGEGFIATSDSYNDGIAVIEADGSGPDGVIDLSEASGPNGWSLIAASNAATNAGTTIVGSTFDDNTTIVDGAASTAANNGKENEFTGEAGNDVFLFNIGTSTPAQFVTTTVVNGLDIEELTAPADGTYSAGDTVVFRFDIGTQSPVDISLTDGVDGVDLTTQVGTARALQAALDDRPEVTATLASGDTQIIASNTTDGFGNNGGERLDFTDTSVNGGPFTNPPPSWGINGRADAGSYGNDPTDTGDDDRLEITIEITGSVVANETYTVQVTPDTASPFEVSVQASNTSLQQLADDLVVALNNAAPSGVEFASQNQGTDPSTLGAGNELQTANTFAGIPANTIVGWDSNPADGFQVTQIGGTPVVNALSSSDVLDGTETEIDGNAANGANADTILDFVSGTDSIDFEQLGSGAAEGFGKAGATATDYATAFSEAQTEMGTNDLTYFFHVSDNDGGLLFYDANGDNDPDGVVSLPNVTSLTGFNAFDII